MQWGVGENRHARREHQGGCKGDARGSGGPPESAALLKTKKLLPVAFISEAYLGETGRLSQEGQAGGKALRIRHINDMEVRKKRPRGFK
jgi:hypothetical protein